MIWLILICVSAGFSQKIDIPFKKVGYLPNYRFHLIDSLELDRLTHLCIAFANPTAQGKLSFNNIDIEPVVKKAKAANTKILLTLAGGGLESYKEKAWDKWLMPWNRSLFIHEIMNWVRRYEFDGVDIDLEWGNVKSNYEPFVVELRDSLLEAHKIITAALPPTTRYEHLTDKALQAFDYIFIMAYDLTGPFAPRYPGQHAPFSLAVQAIDFWKEHGVEPERLILGMPFYGWDFSNSRKTYSASYGFLAARDPSLTLLDQFGDIYYNGKPLIEAKTQYALEQVSGVMFWEIGQDSFDDYSLLKAVDKIVHQHYESYLNQDVSIDQIDIIESNSLYSQSPPKDYVFSTNPEAEIIFKALDNQEPSRISLPRFPTGIYVLEHLIKQKFFLRQNK